MEYRFEKGFTPHPLRLMSEAPVGWREEQALVNNLWLQGVEEEI